MSDISFITHDGYRLPTARIRCYRFAEELSRRGHTTRVISMSDHLGAKYDGDRRNKLRDTSRAVLNIKLLREIEKHPRSILYMQKLDYHSLATVMASRMRKMPLVFDYDDYDLALKPFGFLRFLPGTSVEKITRRVIMEADANVVSSHYLKDYFDSIKPGAHLIHTGVDTSRFRPGIGKGPGEKSAVVFSWAGVVWGEHVLNGLEMILRCFSKLRRPSSAVLRIHGSGQYWDYLADQARSYSSKCRIELAGWVNPDLMPAEMDRTDIGLLPLMLDSKINRSKSPTKLFEYMALGKPTVSSAIGEACHVIENGIDGFLASCEDEWIEAMEKLIDNPDLIRTMGQKALEKVGRAYSLEVLGEKLDYIVRQIERQ